MSKKVFLNTSPIQYIHQLGLIRIVKELFGKVYVPAEDTPPQSFVFPDYSRAGAKIREDWS
jgi:hypothetical protein